ncbi:MAG: 1-acyl-sn-glycerol-3-phosphate acyltransferase [Planctomycetales bacterium]|nr:1-acyl-sn-glycerol-3-phosphate acyltransferase [Planctomycetales bacterium]
MKYTAPSSTDPRARPTPFTFYPPKNNSLVTWLVQMGIRSSIRRKLRVTEIEISDDDLETLRRLKGERCLLTPSHSGGFEPHIIMYLSKLLGEQFNFVAAMELFERSRINRWLMPRMGVYSIIRGAVDRQSFSMTRQLLASGKRRLVIFPEGEAIWQNSVVLPFQQGVFQLAFKGYQDAEKETGPTHLYCVPIAIKYTYLQDMHGEIDASLTRLESKLDLSNEASKATRYRRLRQIVESVVAANEKANDFKPAAESDLGDRAEQLKLHAIRHLEQKLGLTPTNRQTMLDRIRALFNAVDHIVHEEPSGSEYERQLATERQNAVKEHYDALWRLLQFSALHDGYVKKSMTFERFLDVLCLLEMEVCKERKIWGPRMARIKVGQPVDLKDHISDYNSDKRGTLQAVTMLLETSVSKMLEDLETECQLVSDTAENSVG